MLVDHLLEAGDSGAVVPWYNVRKDLFLDKVRWRVGGGIVWFLRGFPHDLVFFLDEMRWEAGGGTGVDFCGDFHATLYFSSTR